VGIDIGSAASPASHAAIAALATPVKRRWLHYDFTVRATTTTTATTTEVRAGTAATAAGVATGSACGGLVGIRAIAQAAIAAIAPGFAGGTAAAATSTISNVCISCRTRRGFGTQNATDTAGSPPACLGPGLPPLPPIVC